MLQKRFKKNSIWKKKEKATTTKNQKEKPIYCTKDVTMNLRARENVTRRMDETFQIKFFSKYLHAKKQYGF